MNDPISDPERTRIDQLLARIPDEPTPLAASGCRVVLHYNKAFPPLSRRHMALLRERIRTELGVARVVDDTRTNIDLGFSLWATLAQGRDTDAEAMPVIRDLLEAIIHSFIKARS